MPVRKKGHKTKSKQLAKATRINEKCAASRRAEVEAETARKIEARKDTRYDNHAKYDKTRHVLVQTEHQQFHTSPLIQLAI